VDPGSARGARQGRRVCLGSLCNPRDPPGADLHQPGFGKLGHMHVSCSSSSLLHSKSLLAQFCSKQFSPASFSFGPSERLPVRTSRTTRGIRGAFPGIRPGTPAAELAIGGRVRPAACEEG